MTTFELLKQKRVERKKVSDAAGALLVKVHGEKRSLTGEENTEWERRMTDVDAMKADIDRLERQYELEVSLAQPAPDNRTAGREDTRAAGGGGSGGAGGDDGGAAENQMSDAERKKLEKRMLLAWMRGGMAALAPAEQRTIDQRNRDLPEELRALSASTNNAGAYTIPTGYPYALEVALKSYGGIIGEADYIETDSGILLPYPTMNDTGNTGETIAENTAVAGADGGAAAQDMTFGIVNFNAYMSDSGIVLLPIQLLQDSAFDPEVWMNDALTIRLGRRMNNLATLGDGSNKPKGVVPAAAAGKTFASPTAFTYPELLDLEHAVDPAYRGMKPASGGDAKTPYTPASKRAKWMFADTTLKFLKKLVDGASRPLFLAGGTTQGISAGAPDTIDGYEFVINQDMATPAASAKSILFGDFTKFKIRRVKQIQFFRFSERYMDRLMMGFMAFQRWDSNLVDAGTHPIAYGVHASS